MKLTVNSEEYSIKWRYENPALQQLINNVGLKMEDLVKEKTTKKGTRKVLITQPELAEKLGLPHQGMLPQPSHVFCEIINGKGELLARGKANRSKREVFNRPFLRKASFGKALQQMFPITKKDNKELVKDVRRNFWNTYNDAVQHVEFTLI